MIFNLVCPLRVRRDLSPPPPVTERLVALTTKSGAQICLRGSVCRLLACALAGRLMRSEEGTVRELCLRLTTSAGSHPAHRARETDCVSLDFGGQKEKRLFQQYRGSRAIEDDWAVLGGLDRDTHLQCNRRRPTVSGHVTATDVQPIRVELRCSPLGRMDYNGFRGVLDSRKLLSVYALHIVLPACTTLAMVA